MKEANDQDSDNKTNSTDFDWSLDYKLHLLLLLNTKYVMLPLSKVFASIVFQHLNIYLTYQLCLIPVTGYFIFRLSNSEKNNFRRNPKDPKLGRKSRYWVVCYVLACCMHVYP